MCYSDITYSPIGHSLLDSPFVFVLCKISYLCLFLEKDTTIEGKIIKITSSHIDCLIFNTLNIKVEFKKLLFEDEIVEFKNDSDENYFVVQNLDYNLRVNTLINVKINSLGYRDKVLVIIGSLFDDNDKLITQPTHYDKFLDFDMTYNNNNNTTNDNDNSGHIKFSDDDNYENNDDDSDGNEETQEKPNNKNILNNIDSDNGNSSNTSSDDDSEDEPLLIFQIII